MHILIIDDSEDHRDVAEAMLLAAGYTEISTVASAADAYQFLGIGEPTSQRPHLVDLILLDILMPDIDGIETCARIRSEPKHCDVPIIMATTLADMDNLANAFVAGATDYITKPLKRVELVARARSALRLKSELDRRKARERELLGFMSSLGHNRASPWIDDVTGLFVGEVAEAYLIAAPDFARGSDTSVIALAIDRLDAYRSAQGDAEVNSIMVKVAGAVRMTMATVGVVAAIYRSGLIVVIVPEMKAKAASDLGEALCVSVSKLRIANSESIAANYVTASVAVVTGKVDCRADRIDLLTRAVSGIPQIAVAGGNRVVLKQV